MCNRLIVFVIWSVVAFAPWLPAQAAVYGYVDAEGTAHFTDAPTKTQFRWLPAFGVPPGANLDHGQYAELIHAIAAENGVDPALVKAIIRTESNFNRHAVSRKGAQGLMQLMPGTAGRYAVGNAFDPAENIRGGVRYLRFLQESLPGAAASCRRRVQRRGKRRPAAIKEFRPTPRPASTSRASSGFMGGPMRPAPRPVARVPARSTPRKRQPRGRCTARWRRTERRNTAICPRWFGRHPPPPTDRPTPFSAGPFP